MTAIFLSHASLDSDVAAGVRERLLEHGHRDLFLDFHPEDGIPAGRDWEKELYSRLRRCRAVVILCSPESMASQWCFAEITHAKALGKLVIPVTIAPCTVHPIIATNQAVDLTKDLDTGYQRLFGALAGAGLDPRNSFDWDESRSPYPGLPSFAEADAAVYFGREAELEAALDKLTQLRQLGGDRFAVVLGASGSGKSSFVRAGVLPRLARSSRDWLIVPPFRLTDPFRELASALRLSFAAAGSDRWPSDEIRRLLTTAPDPGAALRDIGSDLREAAGRLDATVLLVIDQFEEGFVGTEATVEAPFHRVLRDALLGSDNRLMALASMRSDFLSDLQTRPALCELPYVDIQLKPLSAEGLRQVIEGPAQVSGIELGPGLVPKLLADTKTSDALPLLAFTLRELFDKYGDDGLLELVEYVDKLGSLESAVARTAERLLDTHAFDEEQERILRRAFLSLVQINEEGRYVKQPARRLSLPAEAHRWLDQFVSARLLVARNDDGIRTVEVAHEALFRSWKRLATWLEEEREFLLARQRLRARFADWNASGEVNDELLRGPALDDAKQRMDSGADFSAGDVRYVRASLAHLAQETQTARRRSRIVRVAAVGATLVLLVAMLSGYGVYRFNIEQTALRLVSESSEMLAGVKAGGDVRALQELLAASTLGAGTAAAGVATARRDVERIIENPSVDGHITPILTSAVSSTGRIAARGADDALRLWDAQSGELRKRIPLEVSNLTATERDTREWGVAFSPDGKFVVSGAGEHNASLTIWSAESGAQVATRPVGCGVLSVAFADTDERVVVGCLQGQTMLWDLSNGESTTFPGYAKDAPVFSVAYSTKTQLIASGGNEGVIRIWRADDPSRRIFAQQPEQRLVNQDTPTVLSVAFNRVGDQLVVGRNNGLIEVFDAPSLTSRARTDTTRSSAAVYAVSFDGEGNRIASGSTDNAVRVMDSSLQPIGSPLIGHHGEVRSVAFDGESRTIVSASQDGTVRQWDVLSALPIPTGQREIRAVAFGHDFVATGGTDGTIRLWTWEPEKGLPRPAGLLGTPTKERYSTAVNALSLNTRTNELFASRNDGTIEVWNLGTSPPNVRQLPLLPVDGLHLGPGETEKVRTVAVSADGEFVAAGSNKGVLRVWNARTKAPLAATLASIDDSGRRAVQKVETVAFNPIDQHLVSGSIGTDSTLQTWNPSDLKPIGGPVVVAKGWGIYSAAFSPNGDRIVTGSYDGGVRVFTIGSDQAPIQLSGDQNPALSVTFSPHGDWIVSGNALGAVRVWSGNADYQPMGDPFLGQRRWVHDVAFNQDIDNPWFVSASADGTIHFWPAQFDLEKSLCSKLNNSMDSDQWNKWVSPWIEYQPSCDLPTTPQN